MTTEQKKAIKSLDEFVNTKYGAFSVNEGRQILNLIKEQEKEIEKYKKLYQKALDDAVVTAHDNMQKDKIIDELAKAFKQDDVRSVEEIKLFYERKVKDEKI